MILLTPWETFTLFFLRSIGNLRENVQPFFNADQYTGGDPEPNSMSMIDERGGGNPD
jgi:hypothetical protein